MKLAMIGLGRMGANMALRLMRGGHECVVYDRNPDAVKKLEGEGAIGAKSLDDLVKKLDKPACAGDDRSVCSPRVLGTRFHMVECSESW